MGYDDGVCERAADGVHDFELQALVPGRTAGMAMVSNCRACGVPSYEASAADDPRREP